MKEWLLTNKEIGEAEADGLIESQDTGEGNPLFDVYRAIAKAQVKKIEQLKERFCQEVKTIEQNCLRKWRLELGFSMQELAVKAHVSPATVNTIEHYGHYPRAETRSRIAAALGILETTIWPSPLK